MTGFQASSAFLLVTLGSLGSMCHGQSSSPGADTTKDPAAAAEALKFFAWAYSKGDKMAEDLDYIPMPESVVKLIEKTWSADIKS